MLKALAHPSRISIMVLLCDVDNNRMTVKRIYSQMKMPQPVISRHLGILKNVGLVERISEGSNIFYGLSQKNELAMHITKCFSRFTSRNAAS